MTRLAQIGVILSILSRAIVKYALFPVLLLTALALLFPTYFYIVPYKIIAWSVSLTILFFVLYVLVFGILELTANTCIQKKIILVIFIGLLLGHGLLAQVPNRLYYQGFLTDKQGEPLNTSKNMKIGIYNALQGGSSLWQEDVENVKIADGWFSILLGEEGNRLSPDYFLKTALYLEIEIDGEVLTPRQFIASTPFSRR